MSLVSPVSGFQNTLCSMVSGANDDNRIAVLLSEMIEVGYVFEQTRTSLNDMSMNGHLEFQERSVFPAVMGMVEQTIGPWVSEEESLEVRDRKMKAVSQMIRLTVETFMPWDKFLHFATEPIANKFLISE